MICAFLQRFLLLGRMNGWSLFNWMRSLRYQWHAIVSTTNVTCFFFWNKNKMEKIFKKITTINLFLFYYLQWFFAMIFLLSFDVLREIERHIKLWCSLTIWLAGVWFESHPQSNNSHNSLFSLFKQSSKLSLSQSLPLFVHNYGNWINRDQTAMNESTLVVSKDFSLSLLLSIAFADNFSISMHINQSWRWFWRRTGEWMWLRGHDYVAWV